MQGLSLRAKNQNKLLEELFKELLDTIYILRKQIITCSTDRDPEEKKIIRNKFKNRKFCAILERMDLNLIWPEAVIVSCTIIVKTNLYSLVLVVVVVVVGAVVVVGVVVGVVIGVVVGVVVNFDEVVMS